MKQMMNKPLAGCLCSMRLAKKPSHHPALPIIVSFYCTVTVQVLV